MRETLTALSRMSGAPFGTRASASFGAASGLGIGALAFATPGAFQGVSSFFPALHLRNHALDAYFYDMRALSRDDVEKARQSPNVEGGVLIVEPGLNGAIEFVRSAADYFSYAEHRRPRALCAPGVGSSALGAAAFARNVADAIDAPVAAVVAGYGVRDALWEGLGGWFWFRRLNVWRRELELREAEILAASAWPPTLPPVRITNLLSPDTRTLRALFAADAPAFDLIVGLSKGNLSIAEALYQALDDAPDAAARLLETAHIVTISAAIYMPNGARRVTDTMGQLDDFGKENAHDDVEIDIEMPGAWHHTNTELCASLSVVEAVRKARRFVGEA